MSHHQTNRRRFIQQLLLLAGTAMTLQISRAIAWAQGKPELLDLTEKKRKDAANKSCVQAAKNINYRDNTADLAKDVKAGKVKFTPPTYKDKAGKDIPLDARKCKNCALFALTDPKLNTCALIQGCLVAPEGTCTSWGLKPGTL